MPYPSNLDLPEAIRRVLPEHAQDIYRAAFNNAWEREALRPLPDEGRVHRIAWGAVKRQYRKVDGVWRRRDGVPAS